MPRALFSTCFVPCCQFPGYSRLLPCLPIPPVTGTRNASHPPDIWFPGTRVANSYHGNPGDDNLSKVPWGSISLARKISRKPSQNYDLPRTQFTPVNPPHHDTIAWLRCLYNATTQGSTPTKAESESSQNPVGLTQLPTRRKRIPNYCAGNVNLGMTICCPRGFQYAISGTIIAWLRCMYNVKYAAGCRQPGVYPDGGRKRELSKPHRSGPTSNAPQTNTEILRREREFGDDNLLSPGFPMCDIGYSTRVCLNMNDSCLLAMGTRRITPVLAVESGQSSGAFFLLELFLWGLVSHHGKPFRGTGHCGK